MVISLLKKIVQYQIPILVTTIVVELYLELTYDIFGYAIIVGMFGIIIAIVNYCEVLLKRRWQFDYLGNYVEKHFSVVVNDYTEAVRCGTKTDKDLEQLSLDLRMACQDMIRKLSYTRFQNERVYKKLCTDISEIQSNLKPGIRNVDAVERNCQKFIDELNW